MKMNIGGMDMEMVLTRLLTGVGAGATLIVRNIISETRLH